MSKRKRILFIALDFPRWVAAKSWSYPAQFAYYEGLKNQGHDIELFIFTKYENDFLLRRIRNNLHYKLLSNSYDEIWAEVVHSPWNSILLDDLQKASPIRIGFICESMTYTDMVYNQNPLLKKRKESVLNNLKYFTHALAYDEADIPIIQERGIISFWLITAIPEEVLKNKTAKLRYSHAVYCGAMYKERIDWLNTQEASTRSLLIKMDPLENQTIYPTLFNILNYLKAIIYTVTFNKSVLIHYLDTFIIQLRKRIFRLWIRDLSGYKYIVNLPHIFQSFPSRVFEVMAAQRPIITCKISHRPRIMNLFNNGGEILLYDPKDTKSLSSLMRQLENNDDLIYSLGIKGFNMIYSEHTIDKRLAKVKDEIGIG